MGRVWGRVWVRGSKEWRVWKGGGYVRRAVGVYEKDVRVGGAGGGMVQSVDTLYTSGRHAYSRNGRGRTRVKTSKSSQSVLD